MPHGLSPRGATLLGADARVRLAGAAGISALLWLAVAVTLGWL